jgi:hypothetical protein
MWEPRRLTTLWAFTACCGNSFTFFFFYMPKEHIHFRVKMYKLCNISGYTWYGCLHREEQNTFNLTYGSNTCICKWLTKKVEVYGNNLFMDNSFSLPDILNDLTKKKITVVVQSDLTEGNVTHFCLLHASCWFHTWLTLQLLLLRQDDPLKCQWTTSTRLCCITVQKTVLLMGSACPLLPRKCQWTLASLHGITYQKTGLFIGCVCFLHLSDFLLGLLLTPPPQMEAVCSSKMLMDFYHTT